MRKLIAIIIFLAIGTLLQPLGASAGFGISPPFVENEQLTRGSTLEQKIMLVRSEADENLKVSISVNVPGAESWFSIDKGKEFFMAEGERRVPMLVRVTVPPDAEFGDYKGNLHVLMSPSDGPERGSVGIALGAQIDVALAVVDRKIFEFKVRGIQMEDIEEGYDYLWMYIPAKIRMRLNVENVGNVPSAPTKVELDIYDAAGKELLESLVNSNEIERVAPFETGNVFAEFPSTLPAGSYRARYRIYNIDTVVQANELRIGILPQGTLDNSEGYTFLEALFVLPRKDQMILGGGALAILSLLIIALWLVISRIRKSEEEKKNFFKRIFKRKKKKDDPHSLFRL